MKAALVFKALLDLVEKKDQHNAINGNEDGAANKEQIEVGRDIGQAKIESIHLIYDFLYEDAV